MQIILASSSPYRKAQLENFGLNFEAVCPLCNEEELKVTGPRDPIELTRFLAHEKAASLRDQYPGGIILGSDQMVESESQRLDKPQTHAKAVAQLERLQGRTHRLITSLVVLSSQPTLTFTDITTIRLRPLTRKQIEAYLHLDQPYDCAGAYKIERAGLALVESLESQDPSAIQGLPLISLSSAFLKLDLPHWALKNEENR